MRNNSHTQVAQYIELVRETLADGMINAAMTRTADNATVIFALKNLHGFTDKIELAPAAPAPPLGEQLDEKALAERLDALPDAAD